MWLCGFDPAWGSTLMPLLKAASEPGKLDDARPVKAVDFDIIRSIFRHSARHRHRSSALALPIRPSSALPLLVGVVREARQGVGGESGPDCGDQRCYSRTKSACHARY